MSTLTQPVPTIRPDPQRVEAFAGQVLGDLGAAVSAALVYLGDRLGLYRALAELGEASPAELAAATGTAERYVREWLANQAAGALVEYHPRSGRFSLSPERAAVLADETSPAFLAGGFTSAVAIFQVLDGLEQAFRSGEGFGYECHDQRLFHGIERFFRPSYLGNLVGSWIPALEGVEAKLARGASVADVGCGHGASTQILAEAFPRSRFVGFDAHAESVRTANERARRAGLEGRVRFEQAKAAEIPAEGFDLIAMFDCLHDMGDPVGAAARARQALAPGGTLMLVEPFAEDRLEDNLNPVGRAFYGFSALVCTPAGLSEKGRAALGAQAGETRLREVLARAGFRTVRVAARTPVNLVLEARA